MTDFKKSIKLEKASLAVSPRLFPGSVRLLWLFSFVIDISEINAELRYCCSFKTDAVIDLPAFHFEYQLLAGKGFFYLPSIS